VNTTSFAAIDDIGQANLRAPAERARVLFVITGLETGGAEMTLWRMLAHFDRTKFEVKVCVLRDEGPLLPLFQKIGIPVIALGAASLASVPLATARLAGLIRAFRPHVVQGWMYHGNLFAMLATILSGTSSQVLFKIHQTPHSLEHFKRSTAATIRIGAFLSKRTPKVIYCAESSRVIHEQLGYAADKSCVIEDGFDVSTFAPSSSLYKKVREELGLAPDSLIVGRVGRFHAQKDYPSFLRACALFLPKHPRCSVVLVGPQVTKDNQEFQSIVDEALSESPELRPRIVLLGSRGDVHRLMPAFDVLVNSSTIEAFPNVVGEALLCGVPCVVTDVGDSARMVEQAGLVVPPRESTTLAAAINTLLSLPANERRALGMQGRERIMRDFSVEKITKTYEQVIEQLLKT